jgi:hypothetical protein
LAAGEANRHAASAGCLGKPQACESAADHQQLAGGLDKRLNHEYTCIILEVIAMTVSIFTVPVFTVSAFPVSAFPVTGSHAASSIAPGLRSALDFPAPISKTQLSPRRRSRSSGREITVPAVLAVVLLLALVVAPEGPQVQEAICQRHNGAEACRVW